MLIRQLIAAAALSATLMEGAMDAGLPQMDVDGSVFLVNRQNVIAQEYVPPIVEVDVIGQSRQMREDAARALEEMFQAAKKESKITLLSVSGYRSYSKQNLLHSNKIKSAGSLEKAEEYVAPPGASEHQLGMAMDIGGKGSTGLNGSFGKTKAGIWVKENAHRFGFIIRYQQGWEEITGYNYEPWHVRYVGVKHAAAMYEHQIPMEEYIQSLQVKAILDILEP